MRQFVVSTGELVLRFRAHASRLYDVAFSPELNLLASCGQDQLLKLWRGDVEVDAARHDAWVHGVAFAPGGRVVATAGAGRSVALATHPQHAAAVYFNGSRLAYSGALPAEVPALKLPARAVGRAPGQPSSPGRGKWLRVRGEPAEDPGGTGQGA